MNCSSVKWHEQMRQFAFNWSMVLFIKSARFVLMTHRLHLNINTKINVWREPEGVGELSLYAYSLYACDNVVNYGRPLTVLL